MSTAQMVAFASGGEQLAGYLAWPQGAGPFPGLVVIHEAFGLNDDIKEIAQRFAEQGYVALAVDLFAGRSRVLCMFRLFAGMMFNSLEHGGIRDLKAALDFLGVQPGVDAARLGAIGFCMGGALSIAWSCSDDRLKAIAPFYGMNPRPLEAVRRACPVVGSYPEKDFTAAAGKKLDEVLDEYGVPHDIKVYPGAGHSFFNHGRNYNPEAAEDAWKRVLSFFSEHLRGGL
ncbi:MAG TPA: dienelactone hydrolase family protein [Meiothermus sp.]|nr:dienelactone hydrolase family protein [Meiothermus sp.]